MDWKRDATCPECQQLDEGCGAHDATKTDAGPLAGLTEAYTAFADLAPERSSSAFSISTLGRTKDKETWDRAVRDFEYGVAEVIIQEATPIELSVSIRYLEPSCSQLNADLERHRQLVDQLHAGMPVDAIELRALRVRLFAHNDVVRTIVAMREVPVRSAIERLFEHLSE